MSLSTVAIRYGVNRWVGGFDSPKSLQATSLSSMSALAVEGDSIVAFFLHLYPRLLDALLCSNRSHLSGLCLQAPIFGSAVLICRPACDLKYSRVDFSLSMRGAERSLCSDWLQASSWEWTCASCYFGHGDSRQKQAMSSSGYCLSLFWKLISRCTAGSASNRPLTVAVLCCVFYP